MIQALSLTSSRVLRPLPSPYACRPDAFKLAVFLRVPTVPFCLLSASAPEDAEMPPLCDLFGLGYSADSQLDPSALYQLMAGKTRRYMLIIINVMYFNLNAQP